MTVNFGVGEARVAELADAPDLGSGGQPWGFESPLSHSTAIPINDAAAAGRGMGYGPQSRGHARRTWRVRVKESVHES